VTAENIVDALVVYQATLSAEQIAALRRIIRLVQQDERERIAEAIRGKAHLICECHWPNCPRLAAVLAVVQGAALEERE